MSEMPRLICIADRFTLAERIQATRAAVAEGGVRWIHLRDHLATDHEFESAAARLVGELRSISPDVWISINTRLDEARRLETHFHVTRFGARPKQAHAVLGSQAVVGVSTHFIEEIESADREGAAYVFLSPVFETRSKPGRPGIGTQVLSDVCSASPIPVFALGGVTPERVSQAMGAGAYGVAVLSGIMDASDPGSAASLYVEAANEARRAS